MPPISRALRILFFGFFAGSPNFQLFPARRARLLGGSLSATLTEQAPGKEPVPAPVRCPQHSLSLSATLTEQARLILAVNVKGALFN